MLWEALPTALVAAFSPTTLVIVAGLLARDRPLQLSLSFLAAAAGVTLLVGFLIVTVLADTKIDDSRKHPTGPPALDIGLGVAAIGLAVFIGVRKPREKQNKPRFRRTRKKRSGARAPLVTAVVLGIAMGSPSPLYLLSLHSISQGQRGAGARSVDVVVLAAVVLLMAELPIVAYLLWPERTSADLHRANSWFARNGRVLAAAAAGAVGFYFVVKGVVRLL
jgi:hypothetical protein